MPAHRKHGDCNQRVFVELEFNSNGELIIRTYDVFAGDYLPPSFPNQKGTEQAIISCQNYQHMLINDWLKEEFWMKVWQVPILLSIFAYKKQAYEKINIPWRFGGYLVGIMSR